MVNPGDKGLLRPVGNERIFVPARRPVVGEKCIGYPILGGGRYWIPLDQVAPGDRNLLEPTASGRIAVPLTAGTPACPPPPVASFDWTLDENNILTVTDTSTGTYDSITIGVFADWAKPTYRELYFEYHDPKGTATGIDCSEPGSYYCQLWCHYPTEYAQRPCPYGDLYYNDIDLFTIYPSLEPGAVPYFAGDQDYPTIAGGYIGWRVDTSDFVCLDTSAGTIWNHADSLATRGELGFEHYAGYATATEAVLHNLPLAAGPGTRTIWTPTDPNEYAPPNVMVDAGRAAFVAPNGLTHTSILYLCTFGEWDDPEPWPVAPLVTGLPYTPGAGSMAGDIITFGQGYRGTIFIIRISTGTILAQFQATGWIGFPGPQTNGEVVVWSDDRGVLLYDVAAGTTAVIVPAPAKLPDVSGQNVIYIQPDAYDTMKIYNYVTGTTTDIRTAYYLMHPAINGTTLAWSEMGETDTYLRVWYQRGW